MKTKEVLKIYQIKVTLENISPSVWRRVLVSEKTTLYELHEIIQILLGWLDYHLHEFLINDIHFGDPENDEFGERDICDEMDYTLKTLGLREGSHFTYEYDFGDNWKHKLTVEKILPVEKGIHYPYCIKGKRACPPEDVGGYMGYANFLEAINNPEHDEHESYLVWIGGKFDPEAFDLNEVNQRLFQYAYKDWPRDHRAPYNAWVPKVPLLDQMLWEKSLTGSSLTTILKLPLIKDISAFLNYINENKVIGTPAAGNLTRKAIDEITAQFVNPPELESKFGDSVYRYKTESEVPEIYFIHVLAQGANLISGGRGLRWQLSPTGETYLSSTVQQQFLVLFETWWFRINWLVACRYEIFGTYLPDKFPNSVLQLLNDFQPGNKVEFNAFVDQLIEKVGWTLLPKAPDHIRETVYFSIEDVVINPISQFGLIIPQYIEESGPFFDHHKLLSFELTGLGKNLLDYFILNLKQMDQNRQTALGYY
jgi:hypothetical protein